MKTKSISEQMLELSRYVLEARTLVNEAQKRLADAEKAFDDFVKWHIEGKQSVQAIREQSRAASLSERIRELLKNNTIAMSAEEIRTALGLSPSQKKKVEIAVWSMTKRNLVKRTGRGLFMAVR